MSGWGPATGPIGGRGGGGGGGYGRSLGSSSLRPTPTARTTSEAEATARRQGSTEAELRSTYVDAEEAAMMRSLARINGGDAMKAAGNTYSQRNRGRTQARLEAMKAEGIVPMDPKDEETLRKKQANPYTTISQRAVAVPRVGVYRGPERKPLVDCLPHRRAEEDIRANEGGFERPRAPAGKPGMSSDAKKDQLAQKNQFFGKTPQEVLAEHPRFIRQGGRAPAPQKADEHQLAAAIGDEIHERQQFLDEMTSLGQGHVHQQRIESEIAERMRELKTLEPYLQQSDSAPA